MEYDPIKDRLGSLFGRYPRLLPVLFSLLHLFFLRAWYVRRELRRLLKPGMHVLDAGTGFGQYAWHVARKYSGVAVVGTDIKENYLTWAKACFRTSAAGAAIVLQHDDLTAPNVEGPFDCILAVDVLEHIEDDVRVLEHFARLLASSGHIIVSTPSNLGGSDVLVEGQDSFIGEHVREGYGRTEITRKLERIGLTVVRADYTYGHWGSRAWRMLIKHPIRLLSKSIWFAPLLALYYVPVLPVGLMFNRLDMVRPNATGTGLIVVAKKQLE